MPRSKSTTDLQAMVGDVPLRKRSVWRQMVRERWMYVFIVPGVLWFLLFAYVPLLGNVVAFQDYRPFRGFTGSDWVGWENFAALFSDPAILVALRNTLVISLLLIIFAFPAPILLALLLNSLISERVKKLIQTVVYLPHFISWVIVISIWQQLLGGDGLVARLYQLAGSDKAFNLMADPDTFYALLVSQNVWKEAGWGTIIFFAAIAAIPLELYESAASDGANSWQRLRNITLPGLVPVITMLLILTVGNVLTVGFEQLILQRQAVGAEVSEVLDTFVYYRGVAGGEWGYAAAAGLVKGVIATILVVSANWVAKKVGTEGLF